ncbi:MAG: hypothetical protein HYR63_28925 [Proteobacteria bacterium]|nr:hypothetical protein [Pseudomonadota bacterium]
MMMNRRRRLLAVVKSAVTSVALFILGVSGAAADPAQMSLTPAAIAAGFSLSMFADNFPATGSGPLGIAFPSSGGVMVTDTPGNIRIFPTDTDNQNALTVPALANYGNNNAVGLATFGTNIYMTQEFQADVVQLNINGTVNQVIVTGIPNATGIILNPVNGHLFVSSPNNNIIWDVDPARKTKQTFVNVFYAEGLAITADGRTLYASIPNTGHVLGYDTSNGNQIFDSGFIPGVPAGIALGTGKLAGHIFVNTNGGTLVEVNLSTVAQTLLATGGTRGDLATADPNGTLLLTQSDDILRLTGPSGFTPVTSCTGTHVHVIPVINRAAMITGNGRAGGEADEVSAVLEFANLNPANASAVQACAYGDDGSFLGGASFSLPASTRLLAIESGKATLTVHQIFGLSTTPTLTAHAIITTDQPTVVQGGSIGPHDHIFFIEHGAHPGTIIGASPLSRVPVLTATLMLVNTASGAATYTVDFLDDSGTKLATTTTGSVAGFGRLQATLASLGGPATNLKATTMLRVTATGQTVAGWLVTLEPAELQRNALVLGVVKP